MFREKKGVFQFILLSALFISQIVSAKAQVDTASVTGQVTDPQGAAVAGARVVITNQATNITAETTTSEEGLLYFYESASERLHRRSRAS